MPVRDFNCFESIYFLTVSFALEISSRGYFGISCSCLISWNRADGFSAEKFVPLANEELQFLDER